MPDSPAAPAAPVAYLESADGQRWPVASYTQVENYDLKGMAFTNFRITFTLRLPTRAVVTDSELWRLIFPRPAFEIRTSPLAVDSVADRPGHLEVKVTLRDSDRVSYVSTVQPNIGPPPVEQPIDLTALLRVLAADVPAATPATFTAEGGIQGKAKRRRK